MDIEAFINSLRDSQTPAVRGVSRAYDMLPEGEDVEGGVKSVLPWLLSLANDARDAIGSYSQTAQPKAGGGFEMYRDAGPAQAEATPLPAQVLPQQAPQPLRGGEVSVEDILALASPGDVITARGDRFGLSNDRSKGVSKYDDTASEERYRAALLDPQQEAAADENMQRLLQKIQAEADAQRPSREGQRAQFIERLITSVTKNNALQPADYGKVLAQGMALFDSQMGGGGQVAEATEAEVAQPVKDDSITDELILTLLAALAGRKAYKVIKKGKTKATKEAISTLPALTNIPPKTTDLAGELKRKFQSRNK